ncbi:MAG: glycosyltransferase family 39 protein [Acidobacteria bacterium]|nr:glycosyltransferase family 39 protein [Acidobacteriota bacterium]
MGGRTPIPQPDKARPRRANFVSTGLVILFACAVLLPLLGHKPLADWDEGIYAEAAREMLGRSWLVPTWNFHPWFEKPPLMLWTTAFFFKVFGVHEFWARVGSALSGVAIVGVLHAWLSRRVDCMAAGLSSFILLTTFGFLHVCCMGEMDVMLSLGCAIAVCGLSEIAADNPRGWYWFWGGFAIALMTKGAASVVLVLTVVIVAVLGRWSSRYLGKQFWLGLAGFLLAVVPWHAMMWHRFGSAFLAEYLGFHTLMRATQQIEGHTTHWWFYLWVLLVSAAPYVLIAPVAINKALKRAELRPWAVFALVVLIFFSAVQTRLPHYVAPIYPVLAVLVAVYVSAWLQAFRNRQQWSSTGFWLRLSVVAVAAWGLCALVTTAPRKQLHSEQVNGRIIHEERESIALLRQLFRSPQPAGPVLVWRETDTRSIATVIFYTQRPVQQVELNPSPATVARDRYYFDPVSLDQMVTTERRVILLDKSLVSRVPQGMVYQPLASGKIMEVGTIRRIE